MKKQESMPFVEALEEYKRKGYIPFHTPGHKIGTGASPLLKEWMEPALSYDLGVMYALDDLHEPEGALLEAEQLASELYGADYTWFSINGTTSLIETMIMATVGEGETLLIPRDAHRSVHSGLVLSGAVPAYMETTIDEETGIPLGITKKSFLQAIEEHPAAKAVLFVYPNYFGVASNLEELVVLAHEKELIVLVDEAHGAHLGFCEGFPKSALSSNADLVAQSTHKLAGSLTQTSMLHGKGNRFSPRKVTEVFQMLQSTSPNYIFLASLDMARHQLAIEGNKLMSRTLELAMSLRESLLAMPGIRVFEAPKPWGMDDTKVWFDARSYGIGGSELELLLRREKIEVELIHGNGVLVLITLGDTDESIRKLVGAVRNIISTHDIVKDVEKSECLLLPQPVVLLSPREVFHREREMVSRDEAIGRISAETITYYPPGVPFLARGEVITEVVINYIDKMQRQGFMPNGAYDKELLSFLVVKEE